jgi:hypothetical protein
MISRKEFRRQYAAELLPSSAANYAVGDLWDRVGLWGRLIAENNNISYVCNNESLAKQLESIQKVKANFPDIDITQDINEDASAAIPSIGVSVEQALQVQKVERMIIKGVSAKNTLNGYYSRMYDAVEILKKENFDKYKRLIRTKEIVTALFYAENVLIEISKQVENQEAFALEMKTVFNAPVKVNFESDNKILITIANPDCPFAAQLKMGRDI